MKLIEKNKKTKKKTADSKAIQKHKKNTKKTQKKHKKF